MPANDNFADAEEIGGASGVVIGDNIGATIETDEPSDTTGPYDPYPRATGTPLRTVWYHWTHPTVGPSPPSESATRRVYQFSTRWYDADPAVNPPAPLRTVVQVFTRFFSGGLRYMIEIGLRVLPLVPPNTSYHARSNIKNYARFESGSSVQFEAFNAQGYWIRVDGVDGAQGSFALHWQEYFNPIPGICDEFADTNPAGHVCVSILTLGDVTLGATLIQSFGTFAAGTYIVRYIRGAWFQDITSREWAGIRPSDAAIAGGAKDPFIDIILASDVANPVNFNSYEKGQLTPPGIDECSGNESQWSHAAKEQQQRCDFAGPFTTTTTGIIALRWRDPGGNNLNAQSVDPRYMNPVFGLYRVVE